MKQLVVLISLWVVAMSAAAQEEPEYRLELGAGGGVVSYMGDFNGNPLKGISPIGTLVAKYKLNPRMAWALNIGYGGLRGSSTNVKTWYPDLRDYPATFKSSLIDMAVRYEYNFWPFGTGREYLGAHKLTPFIAIGLGFAVANAKLTQKDEQTRTTSLAAQLPIGVGVKYKLATRWNLAVEWMMHFTGGDKLDGIADPYGIESSGLFKNTDCYSMLAVTLTYDLWARCRTCHNDRD